jgi:hypothetical protein
MEIEESGNTIKIWHIQHEKILKEWAEIASSYRWLHNQAHSKYRKQNIAFTLPIIILSTIAGTANFSQASLSGQTAEYAPLVIGTLNLLAGLLTTIAEFLKVSELSEKHRSSSLSFGKLSRNIKVELSLPWQERNSNGNEFLKICRSEMDRLLEQSAEIPLHIVKDYEINFGSIVIYKPEILEIHQVNVYRDLENERKNRIAEIVASAGGIFLNNNRKKQEDTDTVIDIEKTISKIPDKNKNTYSSKRELEYIESVDEDLNKKMSRNIVFGDIVSENIELDQTYKGEDKTDL